MKDGEHQSTGHDKKNRDYRDTQACFNKTACCDHGKFLDSWTRRMIWLNCRLKIPILDHFAENRPASRTQAYENGT